jgi:hypothetical protein
MECEVGMVQQAVEKDSKRWDWMHSVVPSFIYAVDHSMTIHFPRKRSISVSPTHAIRTWDRGAKKFGSLKDFEVHSILKKEPLSNG